MNKQNIIHQIQVLDNWFEKNKFMGYDIYDLYDTRLFHWLITDKPALIRKINRKFITWFIKLFPNLIIALFNKKKNINSKAMGLLLKGYCNLYNVKEEQIYLQKAEKIADWLIQNKSQNVKGYGWGYPFDWSGSKFIPKYTPSSVVSAACGDGFYTLYKITNKREYLKICEGICEFFLNDLNIDEIDKDHICFSYTPIDNDHVNNANLFVAEFLIRVGKKVNNEIYLSYGKKAVAYTLGQQNENGSILYWGQEDGKRLKFTRSNMDHYHSGFELRMLWKIKELLNDKDIKTAFDKYEGFYYKNFIVNSIPMYRPKLLYPINIHACAEAILCNSIINNGKALAEPWFDEMMNWIDETMKDKDGLYIYEINRFLGINIKTKYKFLRWAQAWMFLALTENLMIKEMNIKI